MASFWGGAKEGFVGAAEGTWEGMKALGKGGYELATNPEAREQAWEATKVAADKAATYAQEAYDDPERAYQNAKEGALAAYTAAENFVETADAEDWGKLAGGGVFEVGTALIPVGALVKVGRFGKLAKIGDIKDTRIKAQKKMMQVNNDLKVNEQTVPTLAIKQKDLIQASQVAINKLPNTKPNATATCPERSLRASSGLKTNHAEFLPHKLIEYPINGNELDDTFLPGYQLVEKVLEEDLVLVQYHSKEEIVAKVVDGKGRTVKFWTTTDQANVMPTVKDVSKSLALSSAWGDRSRVSKAVIPKGSTMKAYVGKAKEQRDDIINDTLSGEGEQMRFLEFDTKWIKEMYDM